jgi:esterase/lipase superfamily enzyme
MGNQVLETFLRITSYYKVDLNPIYNKIFLVGCDVRWDSFEKASRFKSMHKITPEVNLFVNRKDFPLLISSVLYC